MILFFIIPEGQGVKRSLFPRERKDLFLAKNDAGTFSFIRFGVCIE